MSAEWFGRSDCAEDSQPSGSSGLILGLILGLIAGESRVADVAPLFPLFLLPRGPLLSDLLPFSKAAGVEAFVGEKAEILGLADADGRRAEDGVLSGPSLGVLRAETRGVFSADGAEDTEVLICAREGFRGKLEVADSGRTRSSSCDCPFSEASVEPDCPMLWPCACRIDSNVCGVAAPIALSLLDDPFASS